MDDDVVFMDQRQGTTDATPETSSNDIAITPAAAAAAAATAASAAAATAAADAATATAAAATAAAAAATAATAAVVAEQEELGMLSPVSDDAIGGKKRPLDVEAGDGDVLAANAPEDVADSSAASAVKKLKTA